MLKLRKLKILLLAFGISIGFNLVTRGVYRYNETLQEIITVSEHFGARDILHEDRTQNDTLQIIRNNFGNFSKKIEKKSGEKQYFKSKEYCYSILKHKSELDITNGNNDTGYPIKRMPDLTTDEEVLNFVKKGCQIYRKRYKFMSREEEEGYATKEEAEFPISYSILIHSKIHQFSLLLSAIYRTQNLYCVHLDSKSNSTVLNALVKLTSCFSNVFISTKRERVVYASFNRLLADVDCMRDLLATPKTLYNWKYLINLCGQDFPVSTNFEIVRQLKELKGKNSIGGTRELNDIARKRTDFVHIMKNVTNANNETIETDVQTFQRHIPPPFNLTVLKNLAYNTFSRDFLQWALVDSREGSALLNWSSVTHTPDEHFWSMLNTYPGAPGGSKFISWWQVSRILMWSYSLPASSCHGYWQRNVCVFGAEDLHWIMSKPQMFGNKFDITYDVTPVTCLRQFMHERTNKTNGVLNPDRTPLLLPDQLLT